MVKIDGSAVVAVEVENDVVVFVIVDVLIDVEHAVVVAQIRIVEPDDVVEIAAVAVAAAAAVVVHFWRRQLPQQILKGHLREVFLNTCYW